ncbi:lanthionine synthetase C family protein [Streptomyces johnsoniae]|uniref:Lanthionine synthetase C family protein n=1 Tax=Streptomyces johnsoniae TaxID=3075532 RepID=A0ABU2SAJ7_9ACTN|nr:lanthionine synthetase C family protein [Streptomyces sp. DSM 41886]MDT0445711.1 lanthionine synthetase C family protein [Streptomyces sp. DSM 41886]
MIPLTPPSSPPPGWGQSLSTGAAGIALAHMIAAGTGRRTWATAHTWAAAMTREPVLAHPDVCGLFHGAPAIAFTLHTAAQPAYHDALATLDGHIMRLTRACLDAAHRRIDRGELPRMREFDLISGLTGIGVHLHHRHRGGDLLAEVLSYLVRLAAPLTIGSEVLPGWWTTDNTNGRPCPDGGHGNLGMAHGVTGPLALLATTLRHGIIVPGHIEAIEQITTWLDSCRQGTEGAPWWPEIVSRTEHREGTVRQRGPGRPSWCYGTPGLARAQQLAALALSDTDRKQQAEQALAACLADERQLAQLSDTSVCHGWAGLLQAARRTAADAHDQEIATRLTALRQRLDGHLHHRIPDGHGLLEGTAGIELTCSTASETVAWDTCLLLAG